MAAETGLALIRRADYQPPCFALDSTQLDIALFADHARVTATLSVRRLADGPLLLNGEGLELVHLKIDGQPAGPQDVTHGPDGLLLTNLGPSAEIEVASLCDPWNNKALEGLYASGPMLCTQCEPEGFRRIAFFPDRPDMMSVFRTRIEADKSFIQLLSNGNLLESGDLPDNRHYAIWEDPHPKPSYLFALVAGDLAAVRSKFVTASGRPVQLVIYVEHGNEHLADHAMASLIKSMRWDEQVYGLEYDLDLFQIVAVSHFNMGAMENKGLNIFNSKFVLADAATATDSDLDRVESIIAHEYFHNWTGNRVTCRDWFQLTLKEGLTVFRDQCFSADMHDAEVKRAEDVALLRAFQFPEETSPNAHPIRPESYAEINNFYTATVYEKGAEVIRMLHTLLGASGFRAGMDLYFARHDGAAVTCDDFLAAMADANAADLSAFQRWYVQAGTPHLSLSRKPAEGGLLLEAVLTIPQTHANTPREPVPVPLKLALFDRLGQPVAASVAGGPPAHEMVVLLTEQSQQIELKLADPAVRAADLVPSYLRGFSAPVQLSDDLDRQERLLLLAADTDLFARQEAGQKLATEAILARLDGQAEQALEDGLAEALAAVLQDGRLTGESKALMLALPGQAVLEAARHPADPPAIFRARRALLGQLASQMAETITAGLGSCDTSQPAGRALQNRLLDWALAGQLAGAGALAEKQAADRNMTLSQGALQALGQAGGAGFDRAVAAFGQRWQENALVMEKYFALIAGSPVAGTIDHCRQLMQHPAFDPDNPNKLRSVLGVFSGNAVQFHQPGGAGYHFLAAQLAEIDQQNPQLAARMATQLTRFAPYGEARQAEMLAALEGLAAGQLSPDLNEMVQKALLARSG